MRHLPKDGATARVLTARLGAGSVPAKPKRCPMFQSSWRLGGSRLLLLCVSLTGLGQSSGAETRSSGPVSFIFDDNRMFVELEFIRPDGGSHKALAFVDLGTPFPAVSPALFKELQLDQ